MDFGPGFMGIPVRWSFCDPDTPFIERTVFRSLNWTDRDWPPRPDGLGEVWGAARTWVNGAPVGNAVATPGVYVGDPAWWLTGVPAGTPPAPADPDGTPVACVRCVIAGRAFDCGYSAGYE